MVKVFTDGGARGNPGPAAIGVHIEVEEKIYELSEFIGNTTNNVAEYTAIIKAISWLIENKNLVSDNSEINFYLDSELAYSQIIGVYRIKNAQLRSLVFRIREKEAQLKIPIRYFHIPREQNKKADRLVNIALDRN